jgi:two-component system, NarL family, nitrate/nitrite response regulator NarL
VDQGGGEGDNPQRVVVIDDHELLSSALELAIRHDGRAVVVATAPSIAQGLSIVAAHRPAVVLTDRRLPDGDVEEHIEALLRASPTSRVLLMTGWPTERSSLAALDAGASGIVSKTEPVTRIVDAVVRVANGELVLPAELAHALLARNGRTEARRSALSVRELDVLEALARGESTDAAATRLCISRHTLRNHLSKAMLKLGVHDRLGAVSEAIRLGLVSPHLPGASESPGRRCR